MQMWKQNRNRISRFSNLSICVIICYSPLPCLVKWSVSDCYRPTAAGPFNSARDPQPTPIQTSLLSCCMFLSEKKKKNNFSSSFSVQNVLLPRGVLRLHTVRRQYFQTQNTQWFSWIPTTESEICFLVFSLFSCLVWFHCKLYMFTRSPVTSLSVLC